MKTSIKFYFVSFLALFLFSAPSSRAMDIIDQKVSYVDSKFLSLGLGLGFGGLVSEKGISGDSGFGFRFSLGHHFNEIFQAEIIYQLFFFDFHSPDPIDPTLQLISGAAVEQEYLRMKMTYPAVLVQPYISVGFGGYRCVTVNQETALSVDLNPQIPIAVGMEFYIKKNTLSFDFEFGYQFLFGENQTPDTLALLNLKEVQFNSYSAMATFKYHFF